jgi:hypothetical protein
LFSLDSFVASLLARTGGVTVHPVRLELTREWDESGQQPEVRKPHGIRYDRQSGYRYG